MSKSKFTEEQDKFIIENYSVLTTNKIADELNKTPNQIRHRASVLGVQKEVIFTNEEIQFIVDNYATMDTGKIAIKLNKTRKQIMGCASHRNIKKEKFTELEKEYIIKHYSNTSNEKLEENLNIPKHRIIRFANKLGLEKEIYDYFTEEEKQYILDNYNIISNSEIARNIGRTTKQVSAFGWGKGLLRDVVRYDVDIRYFDKIDNEHKAYWLGFLYADGSIVESKRNGIVKTLCFKLELKADDESHIEKFNNDINSNYPIKQRLANGKYPSSSVAISNKEFCDILIRQGCTLRKSLTLTFPNENIIPKHLIHHFIRGYFDGDGSISVGKTRSRYTINFVGTMNFLDDLQNIVHQETGLPLTNINNGGCGQAYKIYWGSIPNVKIWYEYLYKDTTVYLDRKYERFQMFLKDKIK